MKSHFQLSNFAGGTLARRFAFSKSIQRQSGARRHFSADNSIVGL